MSLSILLIGSGKMGQALLGGWIDQGISSSNIYVVDPNEDNLAVATKLGCRGYAFAIDISADVQPDVMVLAVKPQMISEVLPTFRSYAEKGTLVVSIAAGTSIARFEEAFGQSVAIIRTMPNTPAAIRQGMIVCCANKIATEKHIEICNNLMVAVGKVDWIEDESLMDAVTGVSGSGPAYVFFMIEALAAAGVSAGLPKELAVTLAENTVAGAGALAIQSSETAAKLRENVTSPNGTTAAGLNVLMAKDGLGPLIEATVAAATKRSRELG